MIRVARRSKPLPLRYRIETAITRWAADVTHACLIWRKTKRIPTLVIKEAAIAFGASCALGVSLTFIIFGVFLNN
jgi:hypothetical protein